MHHTRIPAVKQAAMALLLLTLVGCVHTQVTPLSGRTYPPLTPEQVTIYLSEDDIPGEYEKVALLTSKGDYKMTSESQMYESVRKKAAEIGANGVLIVGLEEPKTGAKVAQAFLGTPARRKGEMIAIYVRMEG